MGLYIESGKVAYGKVVEFRVYNYRCVRALLDCKKPRLLIIILAFLFSFLQSIVPIYHTGWIEMISIRAIDCHVLLVMLVIILSSKILQRLPIFD